MAEAFVRDHFCKALESFPLQGKKVGVLSSGDRWYEEALLARGAEVTVFSEELSLEKESLDALVVMERLKSLGVSSGSNADIELVSYLRGFLKKTGLFYLSIPVGKEKVWERSYRVYGEKRMKELFRGWRPAGYFGYSYEDLLKDPLEIHEPVFVLKVS